jgi:hypothetical protein
MEDLTSEDARLARSTFGLNADVFALGTIIITRA